MFLKHDMNASIKKLCLMRNCIRFLLSLFICLTGLSASASEGKNDKIMNFYFKFDNAQVDSLYKSNQHALNHLRVFLRDSMLNRNLPVRIIAYASPEGNITYNYQLAQNRLENLNLFLSGEFPEFRQLNVQLINGQLNWSGLKDELISSKHDSILNQKVLSILLQNKTDDDIDKSLKSQLSQSEYRVLINTYFPALRLGQVELPCYSNLVYYEKPFSLSVYSDSLLSLSGITHLTSPVKKFNLPYKRRIQPFALKTNMLFDLASALNVELEVPLAKRWSIAGEWMFPWWLSDSHQRCLEILSGTLEGKFWFPSKWNDSSYNDLTGWYTGLYAGGGLYDIEWDKVGYQGEFYLAAGISAGYAHKLSRSLSLEYGIGIGFLRTNYRKYKAQTDDNGDWHLYKQKSGRYSYIGPTKIKVSLVWRPVFYKKIKKGGFR